MMREMNNDIAREKKNMIRDNKMDIQRKKMDL